MSDSLIKLSVEQLKQLMKTGHTFVMMPNGKVKKVTQEELLFKNEEVEALEKSLKLQELIQNKDV